VFWADGGKTTVANMVLLCSHHHTVVHSSQWTIRMIDGLPYFIAPRWVDPSETPQRNTVHHPDGRAA
jgi:hypothetical protein